jgi:hypothetical protein
MIIEEETILEEMAEILEEKAEEIDSKERIMEDAEEEIEIIEETEEAEITLDLKIIIIDKMIMVQGFYKIFLITLKNSLWVPRRG